MAAGQMCSSLLKNHNHANANANYPPMNDFLGPVQEFELISMRRDEERRPSEAEAHGSFEQKHPSKILVRT